MGKIVTLSFSDSNIIFYDMVGNFIPPEWKNLTSSSGKALSKTSKQILSLIVSRLQSDKFFTTENDKLIENTKNYELQETYYYFEQLIGVCQKRVRQCLEELTESGYINFSIINIVKEYVKYRNIVSISLTKNFTSYKKNFSTELEKNFQLTGNNFQVHNIIDNNKSISESRYEKSSFENEFFEKENLNIETSNSGSELISEDKDETLAPQATDKTKPLYATKRAEEFYPLTEEDAEWLRLRSERDFNLSFINKLLLKLAEYQPNNRFSTKERLLNYMAKALAKEKRTPDMVNNENFNFANDDKNAKIEKFLKEIEYSKDTSPEAQLKRKIAAVFEPNMASNLLQACLFSEIVESDEYILKLKYNIQLSEHTKSGLLRQIQAVYGNKIKQLKVVYKNNARPIVKQKEEEISVEAYIQTALSGLEPIWRNIRERLINYCGKAADMVWFSKLKLVKIDEINNKILLKPETNLIGSQVINNYMTYLRLAFESFNYSYEIVKA
ncbi:MAG TPA: hypothetical protein LFW21_07625 [Rickettsia endosymbiont of Pyrocoelia pectoralis]|nr:hypothetical protein [Rickettsia endosymbiont of Pyrocoelia pectoralis]